MTEANSRSWKREGANDDCRIEDFEPLVLVVVLATAVLEVEVGCDLLMMAVADAVARRMVFWGGCQICSFALW